MDQSDNYEEDTTFKQIQKAQKTLEDVQSKIKRFKSRKRQKSQTTINKAPFPDLNKYFSYLTNQFNNQEDNDQLLIPNQHRSRNPSNFVDSIIHTNNVKIQQKENYAISINQKVQREKNSSINKIQEFYIERNQILEQKIKEMKMIKQKIIKDQKLLLRNNRELQEQLSKVRQGKQSKDSERITNLKEKIEKMKQKINSVENQNNKMQIRKKDLQKHVKQVLKAHKQTLSYQGLIRPKSSSVKRCQYH